MTCALWNGHARSQSRIKNLAFANKSDAAFKDLEDLIFVLMNVQRWSANRRRNTSVVSTYARSRLALPTCLTPVLGDETAVL
jgi:hypothetical protein